MRHLILGLRCAPGDVVASTAVVRDIYRSHSDKFLLSVNTSCKSLWKHNPYLVRVPSGKVERLQLDYGRYIRQPWFRQHFLTAFHDYCGKRLGVDIPVTEAKPDLHLSEEEKTQPLVDGRYWVILSGGKLDFTTKHWVYTRHQQVVDQLRRCGLRFVQAGSNHAGGSHPKDPAHHHPRLTGVLDLVGKTDLRELMRLIYHAEGVICTITFAMHAAAAFDRPCVVIAGGREEPWWESYTNQPDVFGAASGKVVVEHRYLHTVGLLPCCQDFGCWKSKVTAGESGLPAHMRRQTKPGKESVCQKNCRAENDQVVPVCMDMIKVEHVVEAVMSYYRQGVLPPIGPTPTIILPEAEPALLPSLLTPLPTAQPVRLKELKEPRPTKRKAAPAPSTTDNALFDNPIIGGKLTAFVLCYGDYFDLHQRCLGSLLAAQPAGKLEVRVGGNALGARSRSFVQSLVEEKAVSVFYDHHDNARKYPVMREMFWDSAHPILTPWLLWLDDDTICDKHPDWLRMLAQTIITHVGAGHALFGPRRHYQLTASQRDWVKAAGWYKGRPFCDLTGRESPNGTRVHFASGSLWALSLEAMTACDIPDRRLNHNGGDVMIGEQVHQGGYKLKGWCDRKEHVNWSSVPRRGLSETHAGR